MSKEVGQAKPEGWNLTPLTAEFLEDEHRGYVTALEAALGDPKVRNIALSGNYGVGKSSILNEVVDGNYKDRVVVLSLSTLAPISPSSPEDSVPSQAKTATNRIQQEIVKQLLYREEPSKAPGSRFRRIEHFSHWREAAVATLVGLAVAVILLLAGWTQEIAAELVPEAEMGLWAHLLLFVLAAATAYGIRSLWYGRIHIKKLSAGSATVTLDEKSVSYFDQYLDEIVYFFEVSKRDIVIFEDIDRFNDTHIFETLRALNALLNSSPRIQKRKEPVRFIYAIKDSIFDQLGGGGNARDGQRVIEPSISEAKDPSQAEVIRANRTKFFDLVIPVVPFITHRSARNLAAKLLGEIEHEVKPELIDLAAQHVPDMRLLKNVRNEFVVFRDRIFSGDGEDLRLSQTDLFAMMLYKGTHLTDFEEIRTGTSNLDKLYNLSRKLVRQNVARLENEIRAARRRIAQLDGVTARSQHLGDRLLRHIALIERVSASSRNGTRYQLNGKTKTADDLRSPGFWTELAQADKDVSLKWGNAQPQFSFSRQDISAALNITLDANAWRETDRQKIQDSIDQHLADLHILRRADMGELIKQSKFTVKHKGTEGPLSEFAQVCLKEGLAYQLMIAGYLNRNFTLYTSTFHGNRVTAAATNFLIHHVERGIMDEHFKLSSEDAAAVIRERGKDALKEPALYNIAILDYLLRSDESAADLMIESLANLGEDQRRFLQAYLSGGTEQDNFIERFTAHTAHVLPVLVSQVDLDDEARLRYISNVLANLDDEVTYRFDDDVSTYLADHYSELQSVRSESITTREAERIAALYERAEVRVPSLEPLRGALREAFVHHNLYTIRKENLELAVGGQKNLALDSIRGNERVYSYVLENLFMYLAIESIPWTVERDKKFLSVIDDVLEHDASKLEAVIVRAVKSASIEDISSVSEQAWPALAADGRFPATFNNITRYIEAIGGIDDAVASLIQQDGTVTALDHASEDDKIKLVQTILSARTQLSAQLRARIAADLRLERYLDATEIFAEKGELFGLLVDYDVITADSSTYEHLTNTDWETRERVITASGESQQDHFKEGMSAELVRQDLANILSSDKVSDLVKIVLVEDAATYFDRASEKQLRVLARFAVSKGCQLPLALVEDIAGIGVSDEDFLQLLQPHLDAIDDSELFSALSSFGNEYTKLTAIGRESPKVVNTEGSRVLLARLKRAGIVSTWDEKKTTIKVYKKRT